MTFGKRLKSAIKEKKLTQKEFSCEVGVALRAIEEYVADRNKPSGDLFMKLSESDRFRKYIMWLLNGEEPSTPGQSCPHASTQQACGLVITSNTRKKA